MHININHVLTLFNYSLFTGELDLYDSGSGWMHATSQTVWSQLVSMYGSMHLRSILSQHEVIFQTIHTLTSTHIDVVGKHTDKHALF